MSVYVKIIIIIIIIVGETKKIEYNNIRVQEEKTKWSLGYLVELVTLRGGGKQR